MSETFTLPRSGNAPLRFSGQLLAASDGQHAGGREQNRWHELAVYRTDGGQYVLSIAYRTHWEGEFGRDEAIVCASPEQVVDELRSYDPTEHVGGYPEGSHYADKQRRLLADIRTRFAAQVSEVLADPAFAEEVV